MARRLRMQYPGAYYHVVNRGNYRRDLFESAGAARAFVEALEEASALYRWKVFSYCLMRNHYHLVIETVEPNLVEGMHWLQCTFSTRFNRFRSERGHLFQGRYHAGIIEDAKVLAHIVDYVHLNPVRAGIVEADKAAAFRWSSLGRFVRGPRFAGLVADEWLIAKGYQDDQGGWKAYQAAIEQLANNLEDQKQLGWDGFGNGWAHGSATWKQEMAAQHRQHALDPEIEAEQLKEIREVLWQEALDAELQKAGHKREDLSLGNYAEPWKVAIAGSLRFKLGISISWLAEHLKLGKASSARSQICRLKKRNQHSTS